MINVKKKTNYLNYSNAPILSIPLQVHLVKSHLLVPLVAERTGLLQCASCSAGIIRNQNDLADSCNIQLLIH